ncbi:MAG: DUF1572 domain-containing protein [Acidobacteria bacterium]|nr:MAG: DUF1572 domain-containing protein [Acidobacteriota bacterium]REK02060.1 MAG: DUF1572 domain-containing protein [Acidobacteriota bacterium]REK15018.1 MAG: DUF1572 domain-containing protein [Acidobacteriota bacterium]REK45732.1 MAG: DUF1572 domain-containing protein [Acidobacteriota bacterium]
MQQIYESIARDYLEDAKHKFRGYKNLAEKALEQVADEEFFVENATDANSVAIVIKHIAGNQRSRWRNFLTEDGEKPDRDRDTEFEINEDDRESLMRSWESGWALLFETLEELSPADLGRTVTIRGEDHTVLQAMNRQLMHYAFHIGQIVILAKIFRGADWKSLTVPKSGSKEFNKEMFRKFGDR